MNDIPAVGSLADICITMCKRHRDLTWSQIARLIHAEVRPWRAPRRR